MNVARHFAVVAACVLLAACRNEPPQGYFPLERGLSWWYEVERVTPSERRESRLQIINLGEREFEGRVYSVRKTNTGNFYYLQRHDDGIVRVSKRTIDEPRPRPGLQKRYVIKYPVKVGTDWSYQVEPHLLERPFETKRRTLKRWIDYEMEWRIEATDAKVETPAGRFEGCLHLRGTATIEVPRALSIARDKVTFTTDEWYAPDVGLVRLEHHELENSDQLFGGSITMALSEFEY